jgi:hypothetical protein
MSLQTEHVATRSWRVSTIGFVLVYFLLLGFVFKSISFSEANNARQYFAQVENSPPAPLPPLPVIRLLEVPDVELRSDPFRPLAISTSKPAIPSIGKH